MSSLVFTHWSKACRWCKCKKPCQGLAGHCCCPPSRPPSDGHHPLFGFLPESRCINPLFATPEIFQLAESFSLIFSRNMRCSWLFVIRDFPGGSVVKNPPSNAGDLDSIPGSGRSPGVGNGNPFTSRSIACNASWIEGPVWLQFMGCKGLVTTE